MSFKAKKMLLIIQLNELLFYINNPLSKALNPILNHQKIVYQSKYEHYNICQRKGKGELLETFFSGPLSKLVDIAIWSNLNSTFTEQLAFNYFTRHYRHLLFVLSTNRALYQQELPERSIKIKKELAAVYNRFPGYTAINTFVVAVEPNLIQTHCNNQILMPKFTPESTLFQFDAGLAPFVKYIRGILDVSSQKDINNLRSLVIGKEFQNLYNRVQHNMYTDPIYR